jgi:hypothetical protein
MLLSRRSFLVAVIAAVAVVAVVAIVLTAAGNYEDTATTGTTTSTVAVSGHIALKRGAGFVFSAGPDAKLPSRTTAAVMNASQDYVDQAVIAPLVDGKPSKEFGKLFTAAVRRRAVRGGADHGALTDDALPRANGKVTGKASKVHVNALAGSDGKILYVSSEFTLRLNVPTADGRIKIERATELTFQREGNGWKIGAYRVAVQRSTPRSTTRSTASTTTEAT